MMNNIEAIEPVNAVVRRSALEEFMGALGPVLQTMGQKHLDLQTALVESNRQQVAGFQHLTQQLTDVVAFARGLKQDVSEVRQDVAAVREDVGVVRADVTEVKARLVAMEGAVDDQIALLKRSADLRDIMQFLACFGMDTSTGFTCAHPVEVNGQILVVICMQLLSQSYNAMHYQTDSRLTLERVKVALSNMFPVKLTNAEAEEVVKHIAFDEAQTSKAIRCIPAQVLISMMRAATEGNEEMVNSYQNMVRVVQGVNMGEVTMTWRYPHYVTKITRTNKPVWGKPYQVEALHTQACLEYLKLIGCDDESASHFNGLGLLDAEMVSFDDWNEDDVMEDVRASPKKRKEASGEGKKKKKQCKRGSC